MSLAHLMACHDCDLLQRIPSVPEGAAAFCRRCGTVLIQNKPKSFQRPLALLFAGAVLFVMFNAICAQVVLVINFFWSLFAGKVAPANPWQANTLEWSTSSPPPHENFDAIPVCTGELTNTARRVKKKTGCRRI